MVHQNARRWGCQRHGQACGRPVVAPGLLRLICRHRRHTASAAAAAAAAAGGQRKEEEKAGVLQWVEAACWLAGVGGAKGLAHPPKGRRLRGAAKQVSAVAHLAQNGRG